MKFSEQRRPELDAIRGLAILMVLVFHYFWEHLRHVATPHSVLDAFNRILSVGWSGVDLFFVLSGFLLGGILLDNRDSTGWFKPFVIRRAVRILPAYTLLLIPFVLVVAGGLRFGGAAYDGLFSNSKPLWSYLTFTQNCVVRQDGAAWNGVTWSLAVEEQFYLLLPFMIWLVPKRHTLPMILLFILAAPVLRMWMLYMPGWGGLAGYFLLPARWDSLFAGVLGAYLVRQPGFIERQREQIWVWVSALLIMAAGIAQFAYTGQGIASTAMSQIGYSWFAGFYLALILTVICLPDSNVWKRCLNLAPLRVAGRYSYGIYLYHLPIFYLTHAWLLNQAPRVANWTDVGVTLLAMLLSFVVAAASYHLFEQHFLKWGRRFRYQETPVPSSRSAATLAADKRAPLGRPA